MIYKGMSGWKALGFKTYEEYLQSSFWIDKLPYFLKYHENKCKYCKSEENLNVHHLHYNTVGNEGCKDVIVLCSKCHRKEHKIGVKNGRKHK